MGDALTLTFDQVLSKASGSGCIDLELCQKMWQSVRYLLTLSNGVQVQQNELIQQFQERIAQLEQESAAFQTEIAYVHQ